MKERKRNASHQAPEMNVNVKVHTKGERIEKKKAKEGKKMVEKRSEKVGEKPMYIKCPRNGHK